MWGLGFSSRSGGGIQSLSFWEMPIALGPEDVGLELGAIPHRDVDVLLDLHLVSGFGRFGFFAGRDLLLHGTSQRSRLRVQRYQTARLAAMQAEAGHITPSPTPRARSRPRGGAWRARLPRPSCCRRCRWKIRIAGSVRAAPAGRACSPRRCDALARPSIRAWRSWS